MTLSRLPLRLGSAAVRWHDGRVNSETTATVEPPSRRRLDRQLVIVSACVAIGLVLVGRGVLVSVTGDARTNLPATIESVLPVPEAEQALAQTDITVDLIEGFTGVLVIDGIEIETVNLAEVQDGGAEPGEQVSVPRVTVFEPGNFTLTYSPSPQGPIDRFDSGIHTVEVIYWPLDEGRARARTFSWYFNVV